MSQKIQKYGISFPTQVKNGDYLFDLNKNIVDNVKSQLIHLIFTPEGQRLRQPQFGTNLIQYIFNPHDNQTWDDIVMHVKDKVTKYIHNCNLESIEVAPIGEKNVNVKITFSIVEKDGVTRSYELTQII